MITNFLNQYSPNPITPSEAEALDRQISMEETSEALKQLNTGKSPGPDGLTVDYYKSYLDATFPQFLKAFNSLASSSHTNRDLLEAHITMIPKPGKETNIVSNYRPISLLNVDLKLYAKILANRVFPLLSSLVSLDQVALKALGFRGRIFQYILALYSSPTARIRVNGHLSAAFSISNSTRQGCPLSPFILTLEPLLRRIRANPDIKE